MDINQWFEVGDYTWFAWKNILYSSNDIKVKIWKYCSIANWVAFIAATDHNYKALTTSQKNIVVQKRETIWKNINIGNDVRIWKNAIILKWVNIGTWAVIWAGAIVTKDIPPYAIAVWNPAKVIKYRFNEKTIKILLESERRNWDPNKIKNNYNLEFIYQ